MARKRERKKKNPAKLLQRSQISVHFCKKKSGNRSTFKINKKNTYLTKSQPRSIIPLFQFQKISYVYLLAVANSSFFWSNSPPNSEFCTILW